MTLLPRPDLWSLDPEVLHLNHGSFGAVPRRTQEVAARLRDQTEANPMAWFRTLQDRLADSRLALAGYLGADPDGFALVSNASAGVTSALGTLLTAGRISRGSKIVITDQAYGAVRFACERYARIGGAEIVTVVVPVEATDDQIVAAVGGAVDDQTAVVVVDQITSGTAMVFPVDRLVVLCRDTGVPVIVDGAHAPGHLDDPIPSDADFWTGNFHKWPCAPRGTAGLAVAPQWRELAVPPVVSWMEYEAMPERFDYQATNDYVAWLAAPTSLEVLAELDWSRRRTELAAMLDEGAAVVAKAIGTAVAEPARPAPLMRLVEVPLDGEDALEPFKAQAALEIAAELTVTAYGDRTFLRLSAHAYNSPTDYELLADRLPSLLIATI